MQPTTSADASLLGNVGSTALSPHLTHFIEQVRTSASNLSTSLLHVTQTFTSTIDEDQCEDASVMHSPQQITIGRCSMARLECPLAYFRQSPGGDETLLWGLQTTPVRDYVR